MKVPSVNVYQVVLFEGRNETNIETYRLPGFIGDRCEIEVNFCADQPCESGTCISTTEGYYCQCPPGIIGRRCTLRPCDYVPCHENAICVDLMVFPASRSSFVCRCPKGLRGYDCSQIDNPCEKLPCLNNAKCIPMALRDKKAGETIVDESIYEKYRCECPPYFYGDHCEILTTPDFVMEFQKSGINDYVEVGGMTERLSEVRIQSNRLDPMLNVLISDICLYVDAN